MSNTVAVLGNYNAICDRCGRKLKASELRLSWDGKRVCKEDFETRHPSDFVRANYNEDSLEWTRPEPATDAFIDTSGWVDTTEVVKPATPGNGTKL